MTFPIGILALVAIFVVAEFGRFVVAKLFGYQAERHAIPIMKLPGSRGSTGFRLTLILAGPVTGYLAIAALAFTYYKCEGHVTDGPLRRVAEVRFGYDAADKLKPGDEIVKVNGIAFDGGSRQLSEQVNAARGAPVALTVMRGESTEELTIKPTQVEDRWRVGISLKPERDRGFVAAARGAIVFPALQAKVVVAGVIDIFRDDESLDPGGPVRLVAEWNRAFEDPDAIRFVQLGAIAGTYGLIALALFDLFRALFLILFRS